MAGIKKETGKVGHFTSDERGFTGILAIAILFISITIILGLMDLFTYDLVGERIQETADVGGPAALAFALDRQALEDKVLKVDRALAEEQFRQILRNNFNLDSTLIPVRDSFLKSPVRITRFDVTRVSSQQVQLDVTMTVDIYLQLFKRSRTLLVESRSTLDYHDV